MSYYGNYKGLPKDGEAYSCNCVGGKCSNCGECCTDLLPLTAKELRRIRAYARENGLAEHRQAPFFDRGATDLTCPFRNQQTHRCDIYPARPLICREFICTKSLKAAHKDRDKIHSTRRSYSLRWEVFGNRETLDFLNCFSASRMGVTHRRQEDSHD